MIMPTMEHGVSSATNDDCIQLADPDWESGDGKQDVSNHRSEAARSGTVDYCKRGSNVKDARTTGAIKKPMDKMIPDKMSRRTQKCRGSRVRTHCDIALVHQKGPDPTESVRDPCGSNQGPSCRIPDQIGSIPDHQMFHQRMVRNAS